MFGFVYIMCLTSYEAAVKDICQEFIFGLPCTAKRTSGHLNTATNIQEVTCSLVSILHWIYMNMFVSSLFYTVTYTIHVYLCNRLYLVASNNNYSYS